MKLKNKFRPTAIGSLSFILLFSGSISANVVTDVGKEKSNSYHVPTTISKAAQEMMSKNDRIARDKGAHLPKGDAKKELWIEKPRYFEDAVKGGLSDIKEFYRPSISEIFVGGIRAVEIKPQNYTAGDKVIVYIHGGAYVVFSADVTIASVLPLAEATGVRILSIDYTLAPHSQFENTTDEVVTFYKALLKQYDAKNIAVYGDSAGAALAAGSLLKARDQGVELPAVLVLWSPWSDIDQVGDTYYTLAHNDPLLVYSDFLENAALAYAPKSEFQNPYVSPVYGDFSKDFPPTLIQVGSKETFLSNAIRLYRAIDNQQKIVKLDVYEGMWHVWQGHYLLPESQAAVKNTKRFMFKYLGK
ncbi:MAG: alpha/beta hydrolase [Kangiellaceae bacterium]|nr:alpha/beta hydrolase [Kangiellaceae bacterium]